MAAPITCVSAGSLSACHCHLPVLSAVLRGSPHTTSVILWLRSSRIVPKVSWMDEQGAFSQGHDMDHFLSIYLVLASCQDVPTVRERLDKSIPAPTPSPMTWVPAAFERACLESFSV